MRVLNQEQEGHGLRMAPLIDIVFLLLIFFLVATTFYEAEKDITIKLAQATEGRDREKSREIVVVNVRKDGVMIVKEQPRTIDQLRQFLRLKKKTAPQVVVVVRCDERAYHKYFVRVLNLCEEIGVTGIAVATFETDE